MANRGSHPEAYVTCKHDDEDWGHELLFNGQRVGSEPLARRIQAVANCTQHYS